MSFTGCAVVFIVHLEIDVFYKFVRFLSSLLMSIVIVLYNSLFLPGNCEDKVLTLQGAQLDSTHVL